MRKALLVATLIVASPLMAGCLGEGAGELSGDSSSVTPTTGGPTREGSASTTTQADARPAGFQWSDAEAAPIRPGVQIGDSDAFCTTNFVFTDASGHVYLGTAAHCVDDRDIGDAITVFGDGETAKATVAYSSWATMDDIDESDRDTLDFNDFALLRLDDEAKPLVNPAMKHFGGPVALGDSGTVSMGDKVLTYGNSALRGGIDAANPHEGYVTFAEASGWSTTVYTLTPGIPGDSGSGAMTGDGHALGIVVTLHLAPDVGANGISSLDKALAYANDHGGMDVTLATWDLMDAGMLP